MEQQIDLAVARYAEKKEPAIREKIEQLTQRLTEFRHLATLENALQRCRHEDVRTPEVKKALDELGKTISDRWALEQISKALHNNTEDSRWQLANAALNAIRIYVAR